MTSCENCKEEGKSAISDIYLALRRLSNVAGYDDMYNNLGNHAKAAINLIDEEDYTNAAREVRVAAQLAIQIESTDRGPKQLVVQALDDAEDHLRKAMLAKDYRDGILSRSYTNGVTRFRR